MKLLQILKIYHATNFFGNIYNFIYYKTLSSITVSVQNLNTVYNSILT